MIQSLRNVVAQIRNGYDIPLDAEHDVIIARIDELSIAVGKLVQAAQLLLDTLSRVPQGDANGSI